MTHVAIFVLLEWLIVGFATSGLAVSAFGVIGAIRNRRTIRRLGVNGMMASIAKSNLVMQTAFMVCATLWTWFGLLAIVSPPTAGQLTPSVQVWTFYAVAMLTTALMTNLSLYLQIIYARRRRALMPSTTNEGSRL